MRGYCKVLDVWLQRIFICNCLLQNSTRVLERFTTGYCELSHNFWKPTAEHCDLLQSPYNLFTVHGIITYRFY